MPLFHRESPEERQQKETAQAAAQLEAQLQARSIQALSAGGLPARAQERIAQIQQTITSGAGVPLYSSDLSVAELALTHQLGYRPTGLVAGSCIYHIGWTGWTYTGELDTQTQAMSSAVGLAIGRLRQEVHGMGALGVVGVRLEIRRPEWAPHYIEAVALGTAITAGGKPSASEPFVCGLSAQEYFKLLSAGSRPAGLAFGNSAYYIYTNWGSSWQRSSWYNQEVEAYSNAVRDAQRYAFGRMHAQAHTVRAHGIVGVHLEHSLREIEVESGNDTHRTDYVIEYLSWGTAVVQAPADVHLPRPTMVLDLEDLVRPTPQKPEQE